MKLNLSLMRGTEVSQSQNTMVWSGISRITEINATDHINEATLEAQSPSGFSLLSKFGGSLIRGNARPSAIHGDSRASYMYQQ